MGGIPSKPDYTKSLQVIGAGQSRTGTNSMQLALEILLKGPVQHGGTNMVSGSDDTMRKWAYALRAKRAGEKETAKKLIKESTAGFVGVVDIPPNLVLEELLELYPEAKVVLVTRDPDKWYKSARPVMANGFSWFHHALTCIAPGLRWFPEIANAIIMDFDREIEEANIGKKAGDYGPWIHTAYNKRVKATVPKNRLLVMELSEGWKPLCKFLGKPIPMVPFPHLNDAAAADRVAKETVMKLLSMWFSLITIIGGMIYGASMFWKK